MYIATIQHLNYNSQESKQESKKQNFQFIFLTLVTLKQSQGHQTCNVDADPKQGYNHEKIERSHFNRVWQKGTTKHFVQTGKYAYYLPWKYAPPQKKKK